MKGNGLVILKWFSVNIFALFISLHLAALGFRCCAQTFSGCGEWRLLIAVASPAAEHRF